MDKPIDLRWWLLSNLSGLEDPQGLYKLFVGISFAAFLFLSLSPIILANVRKGNLVRLLTSDITFIISSCALIFAGRWPGLLAPALNPDETLFIAGAMKLMKDPVFWRSVQTGSSGPLNIYPLTLPALFGLRLEYASSRLIGLFFISVSGICLYYSLRYLYGKTIARISAMPTVICIAFMTYGDYIHYSGEHVSVAILAIALLMLCKYYSQGLNNGSNSLIFLFGFTIGLIPYAKLQAVPIACLLFCLFLPIVWIKNRAGAMFLRCLFSLLGGLLLFSGFILLYLVIFSLQHVFLERYIQEALIYVSRRGLLERILMCLPYIGTIRDTGNLFGLTLAALISGILVLIGGRYYLPVAKTQPDTFIFIYYSLALLAVSGYSVLVPGRSFSHYLLFLLIPSGFLFGVFLAELWKILQAQESIRRSLKFYLAATIITAIAVTGCVEFYLGVRKGNPYIASSRDLAKNYVSPVVTAILKYASENSSLVVWGWAAELYVDTGLIQAMREAIAVMYEMPPDPRREYFLKRFASDLAKSRADIFVDAVAPGRFAFVDRKTEGFDAFPEVAAVVKKYYAFKEEVEGVRIYTKLPGL
jgi:hypothetical protein